MISKIRKLNKDELYFWLKNEAGVNNGNHFGAYEGGIELQQIPEEYVEYLTFLRNKNFNSYMNVGIGNCGSFMTEVYIQEGLKRAVAVDNTSYGKFTNMERINERFQWIRDNTDVSLDFYNMNSIDYYKNNNEKFDIIFIDGDHSYEGVKLDYENCLPILNDEGYIVLHDINSIACPGVVQLWNEVKNENCLEFVKSNSCGIGIWKK
jgi:precorrin-6B methylase 2